MVNKEFSGYVRQRTDVCPSPR